MLNVLDLFSGIGGMSLGLESTKGFKTIAFCEVDPWLRRILAKHWPNVPIFHDICHLDGNYIHEPVHLVSAGYPCQPYSYAGPREGEVDDRHLWPEVARLLDQLRPDWFLGENVVGHITLGLDNVLSDLESMDYTCRAFVIPACAVDARHRRERLWILAHAPAERRREARSADAGRQDRSPGTGPAPIDVADRQLPRLERHTGDVARESECGWLSAQSLGPARESGLFTEPGCRWAPEPGLGRMVNGLSEGLERATRRNRLKALGNAVVPQVVAEIGRAILSSHADPS